MGEVKKKGYVSGNVSGNVSPIIGRQHIASTTLPQQQPANKNSKADHIQMIRLAVLHPHPIGTPIGGAGSRNYAVTFLRDFLAAIAISSSLMKSESTFM